MPIRAVLFDFDGTLADSFGAITASTNHVRRAYGLPDLPEAEVRRYVGLGLPHLMADLVPNAPTDEAVALYREHHPTVMLAGTRLMPGVADAVADLARRGYRLAVCSNKRVEFTRNLVDELGLGPAFAAVLGPEDVGGRAEAGPGHALGGPPPARGFTGRGGVRRGHGGGRPRRPGRGGAGVAGPGRGGRPGVGRGRRPGPGTRRVRGDASRNCYRTYGKGVER